MDGEAGAGLLVLSGLSTNIADNGGVWLWRISAVSIDPRRCPWRRSFWSGSIDSSRYRPSSTVLFNFNAELLRRGAIYSAYLDCRALGLGPVADWLLREHG
ncbi:MAG: hypothetical protein IRY83_06060 [Chloroflexi bacterium]|nr:hypothetical protein [Chloroflexota bacterium]